MIASPRVKICGLTRRDDVTLAVSLGAAALGFVFWPRSPRAVTADAVRAMHGGLPPFVSRVGVFVNASPEEVAATVREADLDVVQLHGDEDPAHYDGVGARIVKVATLEGDNDAVDVIAWPDAIMPLVDATDPERRGGTGNVADWSRAARLASRRPIILAGGLTADNVAAAVGIVKPWAIDVSSGVEHRPGIKSAKRMREFFTQLSALRLEDE